MRTLKLTLKRQWFDLIKSGVKLEEYREIKYYWVRRLCWNDEEMTQNDLLDAVSDMKRLTPESKSFRNISELLDYHNLDIAKYDQIQFTNGYSANSPRITVECKGIHIGTGRKEWGAVEGVNYFVIELGDVLISNETETK